MYRIESRTQATYQLLLHNQWRTFHRSLRAQRSYFVWFLLGGIGLYTGGILFILGAYFARFAALLAPGTPPVALVNANLLPALFGMFVLRFLFQKTPGLKLQPYLHLPVNPRKLIRFFQATSLANVHNVYPLLFLVPFWAVHIWGHYTPASAALWLTGVLLVLVASNYANLLIRSLLARYQRLFLALIGVAVLALGADHLAGTHLINTVSAFTFGAVLDRNLPVVLLLPAITLWLALASSALLYHTLRAPRQAARVRPRLVGDLPLLAPLGAVGQLLQLELKMMARARRPKQYLLVSLLFSTLYLVFLLIQDATMSGSVMAPIIGLFASGGFVLNYGQLMFSWESTYFDGLMARATAPEHYIRAKTLLLQGSCLILFLISLPLFIWLRPDLLALHLAFLLYNAGVTSMLIMALALRNRRRIDISRTGGFFNYEGFSLVHWLWFFPTTLPPVAILLLLRNHPVWGLGVIAGLGLVGLLGAPLWNTYFARRFVSRRYTMAEGFRKA